MNIPPPANMVRRGRNLENGWIALPFEVVRRGGQWTVRANGLARLFPKAFKGSATGDYFADRVRYGYLRAQDAATGFARFLRSELGCAGSLQKVHHPPNGEGVHEWLFWGLGKGWSL